VDVVTFALSLMAILKAIERSPSISGERRYVGYSSLLYKPCLELSNRSF
jgi:hypothetical protein